MADVGNLRYERRLLASRKVLLSPRLKNHYRNRIRKVQAAIIGLHRQPYPPLRREFIHDFNGKTRGFLPEHKAVARQERDLIVARTVARFDREQS